MVDEIRRVERVEEVDQSPRDTVVVKNTARSSNALWVILGIIVVILLIAYLWGNPFANEDVDVTPDVNIPQEVNVDIPSPDVNLPDVDVNTTPNNTETNQ